MIPAELLPYLEPTTCAYALGGVIALGWALWN